MQTATDTVRDLTEFVMYLCGLGVALFLLIMVMALIAYPFVMAYAAHLDDKADRARKIDPKA